MSFRETSEGTAPPRGAVAFLLRHVEEVIAGLALVVVVLSVSWGVLSRYVTAQPAPWAGEVAAIAFAWLMFIGAAAGFKHRAHISIDILTQMLPRRARRVMAAVTDLIVVAFCAYAAWLAFRHAAANLTNPSAVLRVPLAYVYASAVIGFALMCIRYVQVAWRRWHGVEEAAA